MTETQTRDDLTAAMDRFTLHSALAGAAGAMKAIAKDQTNQQQQFKFRSIEAIVAAAKPLLAERGLAIVPAGFTLISTEQVQSSGGTRGYRSVVSGRWVITHEDGESISAEMLGEAVDYGDKSVSKAVQMAYKYLLTQLLGIGSEDPDGQSVEIAAREVAEPVSDTNRLKRIATKTFGEEAPEVWAQIMGELDIETPDALPKDKVQAVDARLAILAIERRKK